MLKASQKRIKRPAVHHAGSTGASGSADANLAIHRRTKRRGIVVIFAASRPVGAGGVVMPVSYTHLDVYKRQGYGLIKVFVFDPHTVEYQNAGIGGSGLTDVLPPVSYTHLDVYKRQEQGEECSSSLVIVSYTAKVFDSN